MDSAPLISTGGPTAPGRGNATAHTVAYVIYEQTPTKPNRQTLR